VKDRFAIAAPLGPQTYGSEIKFQASKQAPTCPKSLNCIRPDWRIQTWGNAANSASGTAHPRSRPRRGQSV